MQRLIQFVLLVVVCVAAIGAAGSAANAQVPAFLPMRSAVAPGEATPVDGTYRIEPIGKRITIANGRAYVIDPWVHALVLKVQPDMVVLRNFRQTGPDRYEADDLPLMGKAVFVRKSDGSLAANVAGTMGPARYRLVPTAYVETPVVGDDPPGVMPPPGQPKPRIYRLHVSVASCDGWSLVRKNYRGTFHLLVKDAQGEDVRSGSRPFHVKCTKKGPRVQQFGFDSTSKGSLTLRVPPGQDGFTDLRIRTDLHDPLGMLQLQNDQSALFLKALNMRRDLRVGESIEDTVQIASGKARLLFRLHMKRTQ